MTKRQLWQRLFAHIDRQLLLGITMLLLTSLLVLYSADNASWDRPLGQMRNIVVAMACMWVVAKLPLHYLMRTAVPIYVFGMILLICVALFGEISHGARRWLNLGVMTIQPSELMKIGVPMMMAWYFERHEATLTLKNYFIAALLLLMPIMLIARQPDLGTSLLIFASGFYVLFLAGLSWRVMGVLLIAGIASAPVMWSMLHEYQRHRIMMLFDPSQDALGNGYHTIQASIAVGSGGILGKGYLNGTQTHLDFLPERTTDFIFDRQPDPAVAIRIRDLARVHHYLACLDLFHASDGRFHHADFCNLCIRQHGHGQRHPAGGGCAIAADQLWRHFDADPAARFWNSDEYRNAQKTG
jgi:rod shape determining protein RodA